MVAIVDHRGRPIRQRELPEAQTARLGYLQNEFDGHPSRGLTPARIAQILGDAEQGQLREQVELFEDMEEKDGHIYAEMSKRRRALLGLDWEIVPPRNATAQEERAAELVAEAVRDIERFDDVLLDLADGIGKGYANLEMVWERSTGEWRPGAIEHRPASWFQCAAHDRNTLRLRNMSGDGEALWPFGWISHVHKAKSGYLTRAGLHRVLVWPYLFKNYSLRDLADFLEIYGLPLRLGTYPRGATEDEKLTLLRAVVGIGHDAAGIVPEGMGIDFKEAAKGTKDPFEFMVAWCERTQSKAILGGTLTSQADGKTSTNALGNVHNEVRHDLTEADAKQLAGTLTRDLCYPIAALNVAGINHPSRTPRFVFDTREPEDLAAMADTLPRLVEAGFQIPRKWAQERARIPEPEEGEEILGTTKPPAPQPGQAEARAAGTTTTEPDLAERWAGRLNDEAQAALDRLIEPVQRLVLEAPDLAALRAGLERLHGELDPTAFAELLQRALSAAELAGRAEILDEPGP